MIVHKGKSCVDSDISSKSAETINLILTLGYNNSAESELLTNEVDAYHVFAIFP